MRDHSEACLSTAIQTMHLYEPQSSAAATTGTEPLLQSTTVPQSQPLASDVLFTDHVNNIQFRQYRTEDDLHRIIPLIAKDLSEPYSIYTYRYFIYNWPQLCLLAFIDDECVGTIVCKLEPHTPIVLRGYIAMLAVKEGHRRKGIGSRLVQLVVDLMAEQLCDEVTLETEITNKSALSLYEQLGFCRDKRLLHYYLNGVDAFRLKLWLTTRGASNDI